MHHEQFITRLAAQLEFSHLAFNDENVCRLLLDDQFVIDIEWVERDEAIHVYSVLHTRAAELKPRYAELLSANLFGRATHGATLGLDAQRDEILLTHKFPLENLDLDWFVNQLELFVDSVLLWSRRLEQSSEPRDSSLNDSLFDHTAGGLLRV